VPGSEAAVALSECNVYGPTFEPAGAQLGDPDTGQAVDTTGEGATDVTPVGLGGGGECWPSGWGVFNPLNWVLQPVKCALVWAFIPSAGTVTAVRTSVGSSVGDSGIAAWLTGIGGIFDGLDPGDGCDGPEVTFPTSQIAAAAPDVDMHPFAACTEPMATVASISRAVSTLVIVVGGAFACLNAITAAFGYSDGKKEITT